MVKRAPAKSNLVLYILLAIVLILFVSIPMYYWLQTPRLGYGDSHDKVCLSTKEYERLVHKTPEKETIVQVKEIHVPVAPTVSNVSLPRDYRVLQDPLYPPLNRTDSITHKTMEVAMDKRMMYVPTRDYGDNFRLVGYVVNKDETKDVGGNNWKLFARQKDRNTAEFYMAPSNKDLDIKIPVTDDMVVGTRLRDVFTIPNQLQFKNPMLNNTEYQFIEIPKSDLTNTRYY